MFRKSLLAAIAVPAVALGLAPTVAAAPTYQFDGFARDYAHGEIEFEVVHRASGKRIRSISFDDMPIQGVTPGSCSSGRTGHFDLPRTRANDRGRFYTSDAIDLIHGNDLVVDMQGTLRGGGYATGKIWISVVDETDGTVHCESGAVRWLPTARSKSRA